MGYSQEDRQKAYNIWKTTDSTYQVEKELGIKNNTVLKWISQYNWKQIRDLEQVKTRQALSTLDNKELLKEKLAFLFDASILKDFELEVVDCYLVKKVLREFFFNEKYEIKDVNSLLSAYQDRRSRRIGSFNVEMQEEEPDEELSEEELRRKIVFAHKIILTTNPRLALNVLQGEEDEAND